jgi:hypothetical protein
VFSVDVPQNVHNPRKQSPSLTTATMTQVKRILSGHNRMEKLNNKIIDCLNHLWAIGDHNLAWNHKEDDDSKGKSYCYVHPESGELHNKYQGHPVKETIFYP